MLAAGVEPEIHAKTEMDVFVACCPPQWLGVESQLIFCSEVAFSDLVQGLTERRRPVAQPG